MSRYRSYGGGDDPQLDDGDRGFSRVNARLRPSQLEPGEVSLSLNGRMTGYWQPRRNVATFSGNLAAGANVLRLPFLLVDEPGGKTVTATRSGTFVQVSGSNGFTPGSMAWLNIEGFTGTVNPNGYRFVNVISSILMTFQIPGATGNEVYGGTGKIRVILDDGVVAAVWGSCLYSDPSDSNAEYIIIAANATALAISISDGSITEIGYPPGVTIDGEVDLLQCFDRVLLFRDGERTLEWDGFPATDFVGVPAGDYTQPQVFQADSGDVTVADGKVTVTVTGNVTVNDGDVITVYRADTPAFESLVGRTFPVFDTSATSISFYAGIADFSPAGTDAFELGRNVSVGGGFMHSPAPPWGVYHQRRLWVPFLWSQTGDNTSPVFTFRNVTDEVAASDILDSNTFDQIANQFRITGGTADFLVGFCPFYEDVMVVFMRNSIHRISGISGELNDTSVYELTREVGCLARKTIAMHGPEIFFLSDNGVYSVTFLDQYNLRGVDRPVSAPIQPFIDRINADLAGKSVAVYFANRYYLAVPLDSAPGSGDATGNNAILVYNFLNGGWESVDTVADNRWNITNFHISRAGERNDLYAVNSLGGVHRIDASDSDTDVIAVTAGQAPLSVKVNSSLKTRQYDGQTLDRKRFSEIQLQVESSDLVSDAEIRFSTEDPDTDSTIGNFSDALAGETLAPTEGASLRMRVGGRRGQGAILTVNPVAGRPLIHSIRALSTITNRQTISQK